MSTNVLPTSRLAPQPGFSGILRQQETFAAPGDDSVGNRINGWFDRLMTQTGWGLPPSVVLMLCVVSGVAVGGLLFVWLENPLPAAVGAMFGGLLPIIIAVAVRASRQKQINDQLPGMIDELARAARSGRSLESCLQMVAHDTPAPLGTEMQQCVHKLELGLPVHEAMAQLPERTGVVSTSILNTALAVHRQTGGDLIRVLERLSRTLRDRQQFLGRLRASTTASRLTAFLMIGLPPIILGFFLFRDPEYFRKLMDSSWGRMTTLTAVILMFIGSLWVLRVLSSSRNA
ncbi:MAG: type II secretion system F family protein [Planctomycetaceae bacterium]|nr:type II secretion system F family protein [Planctomycetaceae bacterium]